MTNAIGPLNNDILLKVLALSKDATAVYSSEDLLISFANDAMISFWGRDRSVIGKTLEEAVPELKGQPFIQLMQNVWRTGETYIARDTPADLLVNGRLRTFYFDFEYRAIKDDAGNTYALLHSATDVTDRLEAWQQVKVKEIKERELNTELAATNKELQAINDDYLTVNKELNALNEEFESTNTELATANEELRQTYDQLTEVYDVLAASEERARVLLTGAPVAVGVVDSDTYIINSANTLLLELWRTDTTAIGRSLFEILPAEVSDQLTSILEKVRTTGTSVYGYDTDSGAGYDSDHGLAMHNYVYQPVKNAQNKVISIMIVANDVTEQARLKRLIQYSERRLTQMLTTAPVGLTILKGRDLVIETANEPMFRIWGRTREQMIGNKILEIFPELYDQPFPKMLASIFDTGTPIAIAEIPVNIADVDGTLRQIYVNFKYDPLFDDNGNVGSVIAAVIDITEIVEARKRLEENEVRLQQFNEELTALNEEQESANEQLLATNEELATTNEELAAAQEEVRLANDRLVESENRIRGIFEQAPLGMCVLSGPDHVIEIANESILNVWGRTEKEVLGKPHRVARPELDGQPVYEWLDAVYRTGITKVNNEFRVMLYDQGSLREAYVNSIYQPLRNANNEVIGIMVILEEITEKVKIRQEAQRVQDMFTIAIEAGELATFYYDPVTNQFSGNDLLKSWFGLKPEEHIDLQLATDAIAEDDRQRVIDAIMHSLDPVSCGKYDIEYTIIHPLTQEPRIVKAKGKAVFDQLHQKAISLNGTLLDITERKKDEQRKNDFIGMVSHELKTPLTSLNAYIQMLQMKAQRSNDQFTAGALEKAGNQVKKMTTMINGFLNVTRLESGKIHIDKQLFDMAGLMKETEDEIRTTISSHVIKFNCAADTMVQADRDKIGQVINNLISNAVKYSANSTSIEVACTTQANNVQVSVTDHGIGIKQQDLDKLFDRYYRVEGELSHTISGFGIGLYLSAEIIHRHNGRIWVESEYGKGSTFCFSLPLS